MDRGIADRRRVFGRRMGDQRDAAADGDILSHIHIIRGFRVSAAGGV